MPHYLCRAKTLHNSTSRFRRLIGPPFVSIQPAAGIPGAILSGTAVLGANPAAIAETSQRPTGAFTRSPALSETACYLMSLFLSVATALPPRPGLAAPQFVLNGDRNPK